MCHEALYINAFPEGWIEGSEISFHCCTIIENLSWVKVTATLQFVWHGDLTNWSYQHLHSCIIMFYSSEMVSLSTNFPKYVLYTKTKQYISYSDHLLLISSEYVLSWVISISPNKEAMFIICHSIDHFNQPNISWMSPSPSHCTRIKDPTINKKPYLSWESWQPCLITLVSHKATIHSKHSRNIQEIFDK